MRDTDAVVDIAEGELEQLVCQYTCRIGKAKQRMVREARLEAHGPRMQDRLVAQAAQARVAVDNLDLLADEDVAEDGEKRKHCGEGRLAVDHKERRVVHLEPVRKVPHTRAVAVCVRYDYHLVPAVNQLG